MARRLPAPVRGDRRRDVRNRRRFDGLPRPAIPERRDLACGQRPVPDRDVVDGAIEPKGLALGIPGADQKWVRGHRQVSGICGAGDQVAVVEHAELASGPFDDELVPCPKLGAAAAVHHRPRKRIELELAGHGEGPPGPSCAGELFDERLFACERVELRPDLNREVAGLECEVRVRADFARVAAEPPIQVQPLTEQALAEGRSSVEREGVAVAGGVGGGAVEIPIGEQAVYDGHGCFSCVCRPRGGGHRAPRTQGAPKHSERRKWVACRWHQAVTKERRVRRRRRFADSNGGKSPACRRLYAGGRMMATAPGSAVTPEGSFFRRQRNGGSPCEPRFSR
ncbi:hypothetical protein ABIF79_010032 [Bradyrhizobium japonicum]